MAVMCLLEFVRVVRRLLKWATRGVKRGVERVWRKRVNEGVVAVGI